MCSLNCLTKWRKRLQKFRILLPKHMFFFFFLNDPAPTEISPFPLHDALPISFESQRDGKLVGVDVDSGDQIAKRLGLAAEPMNMEFKGLIPALQGGRLDIINSAMYMTQEQIGRAHV